MGVEGGAKLRNQPLQFTSLEIEFCWAAAGADLKTNSSPAL